MIGLERVTYAFPGKTPICTDLTWTLPQTGVICLRGASGSGKTTLLRLLAGLATPTAGRVIRPERVSVVFQEDRLLPWCRLWENVALCPEVDENAARTALAEVGLTDLADRYPAEVSGGESRRAALARALATPCDLMLLDEPFTGLDEETWRMIAQKICLRAETCPTVLVTHVPAEAEALGATVFTLPPRPMSGNWNENPPKTLDIL